MAIKKIRQALRNYFLTGAMPTANEFADLIESNVNILDDKATDTDINAGTSDDKFVTVLGAKKVARKYLTVNGGAANPTTGDIQVTTITGNAGTATKLAAPKSINGVPFDGSQDITLPAVTTISGNAGTATKLAAPKNINGVPFDGSQDIVVPGTPRILRIPIPNTVVLLDNNSVQSTFANITLGTNKTYMFKGKYLLTTGTTTHTTAIGFAGGDIALGTIQYVVRIFSSGANAMITSQGVGQLSSAGMKILNATSTAATTTIEFEGVIRTGATGSTFVPQIQFSAATGATPVLKDGSYIELNEIGASNIQTLG
ncbi:MULTISPECIES: hypothetical protein [unclassified Flavobacterium]|uniref:hypothetical protein n=1 Tax=unclassified Flavobacterium TaxID=196869 RepID=UPI001F147A1C|nr:MULTISPECIES: hypothetical protein [unclassified Flavobacterium]UMY66136.1 hypothetical protein MKO97_01790 [Flavobacterium sp. HJ-32-4]